MPYTRYLCCISDGVRLFACIHSFFLNWYQQPVAKAPEEKAPKKAASKATEKKGKTVEVAIEEPLDPVAEKLRQQR